MFGFNVNINKTSKSESYRKSYDSNPQVKSSAPQEDAYEKRKKAEEARLEKLEADLKRENEEYERTLQRSLDEQQRAWYSYEDMYADDPLTHQLNLAFIATTKGYKSGYRYNSVKGSFDAASVDFNKNNNAISFDSLKAKGYKYSSANGQKLAKDVANHSVGFTGKCSKYVREGLQRTGLYNGHTGSAYQMAAVLADNKNFQEVSANSVNLKNLPAGCIVVYDRGAAGYNAQHGHIEVTLGDGTACSDGRTYNPRMTQNMRIFVPVEQA